MIRLCTIRDYRRKWIKPQTILQLQETKPTTTLKEMQAKTVITGLENNLLRFGRAGSLTSCNRRRNVPSTPALLWLQHRFIALVAGEGLKVLSSGASDMAEPELCRGTRRK